MKHRRADDCQSVSSELNIETCLVYSIQHLRAQEITLNPSGSGTEEARKSGCMTARTNQYTGQLK